VLSADDLRYFLAVAQRRRLVHAAAQLGVDHTTVSRRIAALERSVGQRLFDRTERGWLLTDAGQSLLEPAEAVDAAVAFAEERLGRTSSTLTGTVRITCPDAFGAFLLAPALGTLRERHPELIVEMVTATKHLEETVRGFDVAVTLEPPSSSRFKHRHLTDYVLRLYATPEYLETAPPIDTLEDLGRHPLIFYVEHLLDLPPLQLLQQLPKRAVVQSTNVVAQWQAAAAGVGVAPLPQFIAGSDPRLVPVLPELAFRRRYWLTLPSEHARLARVSALVEVLDEVVATRRGDLIGPARRPGARS
jgi:DNA-binding transcriptional LysR family regulator